MNIIPKILLGIAVFSIFIIFGFQYKYSGNEFSELATTDPQAKTSDILGTVREEEESRFTLPVLFFEEHSFYQSLNQLSQIEDSRKIYGGVIPHHLLASPLIADFFHRMKDQPVEKIILLSPNHYEVGSTPVLTSIADWETKLGVVRSDTILIEKSLEYSFISVNDTIMQKEHGVGGILPFIKHFLPEVQVTPFIFRKNLSNDERKAFTDFLKKEIDENTVVVASIDFSHYLTVAESLEKDEVTKQAFLTNNFELISTLNSDYLDSPQSLMIILEVMNSLGKKVEILNHTNADDISGKYGKPTTSYFELAFY